MILYTLCPTEYSVDNRHAELLRQHYVFLRNEISICSRFLSHLQRKNVLCTAEIQWISHETVSQQANERLLEAITTKSSEQYAEFLEALRVTKQTKIIDRLKRGRFYFKIRL